MDVRVLADRWGGLALRFRTPAARTVLALVCACHANPPALAADAVDDVVAQPTDEAINVGPSAATPVEIPDNAPRIAALVQPCPIFSDTEFPPKDPSKASEERQGVIRLGYLRKGGRVAIKNDVIKKPNCPEGWYELLEGGYICGKFATQKLDDPELTPEKAVREPLTEGPLPYQYAMNLTNGTPLYRRVPNRKERGEVEKGLLVGRTKDGDLAKAQQQFKEDGTEVPWYLQDHKGQKPMVSFDDMKGDRGLVILRMVKGFYIAIDRPANGYSGKYWKTTAGDFAPVEHLIVHKSVTEFQGVQFTAPGETRKLPLGWILSPKAWKYRIDEDEKKAKRNDHVDRFTIVELTGKKITADNRVFYETKEGWWMRDIESTQTKPGAAPWGLKKGEKWIDVNITTQTLVAFEGSEPYYATLVSSGRHDDKDVSKDHKTKTGNFFVREKHIAATMDDDSASDGPYSIQDVPWIMYFRGSEALHGAFWHSSFGHERSHGCVNMTPFDAKNLFGWVGPRLPSGWHGVRATDKNPGTRVVVHE